MTEHLINTNERHLSAGFILAGCAEIEPLRPHRDEPRRATFVIPRPNPKSAITTGNIIRDAGLMGDELRALG